jgi:hypothetical protein
MASLGLQEFNSAIKDYFRDSHLDRNFSHLHFSCYRLQNLQRKNNSILNTEAVHTYMLPVLCGLILKHRSLRRHHP